MSDNPQMREAFERYCIGQGMGSRLHRKKEHYTDHVIQFAWEMWVQQAALQSRPQASRMSEEEIVFVALQSGFMLSTMHGQSSNKMMPVSDSKTLLTFARALSAGFALMPDEETAVDSMAIAMWVDEHPGQTERGAFSNRNTLGFKRCELNAKAAYRVLLSLMQKGGE